MLTDSYTIKRKLFTPSDPRLGRHVNHDSRSLRYQVEAEDLSSLKSIRHTRYIPILDQGQLGCCTGNAGVGVLGSGIFWSTGPVLSALNATDGLADEAYAVDVYSAATLIDPYSGSYPPTDTGSDGLSVAKVLQKRGLISGYEHATSLEATLTALSKQPVMVGTVWKGDMFNPSSDGRIKITGNVEGGHEYELDELDVENKVVWMANSWTEQWGITGRAYLTWDDLGSLLDDSGDCTVFTPSNQPAPQPTPPSPEPPEPTPPSPDDPKQEFLNAARNFQVSLSNFTDWYAAN